MLLYSIFNKKGLKMEKWQDLLKRVFGSIENAGNAVGVGRSTVLNWRHGVPHWYIKTFIKEAKQRGFKITAEQLRGDK